MSKHAIVLSTVLFTCVLAAASAATITITDANIVYILDQANAADSARGHLAASKATSTDVRQFGKLMAGKR
jgi:predicted outer membrane protein